MSKIVRIHAYGGSETMKLEELPDGQPEKGEVRLRIQAIGLNRSDILFRRGFYTPHKRHMKSQYNTSARLSRSKQSYREGNRQNSIVRSMPPVEIEG